MNDERKWAVISACGNFRYALGRNWDGKLPTIAFVGLNPSVADDEIDDPTIRRCIGFAKREGCGSLIMLNLYALRSTAPAALRNVEDPLGPEWAQMTELWVRKAQKVVACWGADPMARKAHAEAVEFFGYMQGLSLWCLGKTKDGYPRHPLYIRSDQPLEKYLG